VLAVEAVRKLYGHLVALDGVDLTVGAGEIVGLVGPNGAGKTTLVSIIAGLRRADSGSVRVGDIDVGRHRGQVGRLIGLAPQELAIYPRLRVRENLVLFGELAGLRREALRTRIEETADALSLTPLLDRPAEALSGGQRRRLHTAMALIHRPPLLLLDEPTVGADIETRAELLRLVRRLAEEGAAVVYSTHYLPEVEQLGATVAVIDRGRILARGSLADLLRRHAKPAVELVFDGPPPASVAQGGVVDGSRVRIPADDPAATAASVLSSLGDDASRLSAVELIQPTLDAVYLSVTGRRFQAEQEGEVTDVVVA
jgi:ABC-2 type transport system ATP-binding protein